MSSNVIPISFGNLRGHSLARKATRCCGDHAGGRPSLPRRRPRADRGDPQDAVPRAGRSLGKLSPALIAALYAAFLDRSIFLVHTSNGKVDGFVLGGSSRELIRCKYSFLCRHALFCLADVVRRPRLWLRVFRSFVGLVGGWLSSRAGALPEDKFRMLSIAVNPRAARKGVGTALVRDFEVAIRAVSHTYCLNVLKNNTSAIRFYEKLAFQCVGETDIAWTLRKDVAAADAEILPLKAPCDSPAQARGVGLYDERRSGPKRKAKSRSAANQSGNKLPHSKSRTPLPFSLGNTARPFSRRTPLATSRAINTAPSMST